MSRFTRIGHVVLWASDLAKSKAWYMEVLGMEEVVSSREFRMAFLSFGTNDHDIALAQAPDGLPIGGAELNHLAIEFKGSLADYKAFYRMLKDKKVKIVATIDHRMAYGIYFNDPDGHCLEAYFPTTDPGIDQVKNFRQLGVYGDAVDIEALED